MWRSRDDFRPLGERWSRDGASIVRKRMHNLSRMFIPLGVVGENQSRLFSSAPCRGSKKRSDVRSKFLEHGRPETLPMRIGVCRVDSGPKPEGGPPGPRVDSALSRGTKTFLGDRDGRKAAKNSGSSD